MLLDLKVIKDIFLLYNTLQELQNSVRDVK